MTNIICVLYNDPVSARSVVAVEDDAALAELKGSRLADKPAASTTIRACVSSGRARAPIAHARRAR